MASAAATSSGVYAPYTSGKGLVTPYWVERYEREAGKNWDRFYQRNADRFFKDRHYLQAEWTELQPAEASAAASGGDGDGDGDDEVERTDGVVDEAHALLRPTGRAEPLVLLEAGCGVGNTLFPLLRAHPALTVFACDVSQTAVEIVQSHPLAGRVTASVGDLTSGALPAALAGCRADVATLIFVLSAIAPAKMRAAVDAVRGQRRHSILLLFLRSAPLRSAPLRSAPADAPCSQAACARAGSCWCVTMRLATARRSGCSARERRGHRKVDDVAPVRPCIASMLMEMVASRRPTLRMDAPRSIA